MTVVSPGGSMVLVDCEYRVPAVAKRSTSTGTITEKNVTSIKILINGRQCPSVNTSCLHDDGTHTELSILAIF
jgi:hypothetical protein